MQKNIRCLMLACQKLGLAYKFLDQEKNFISVNIDGYIAYFKISVTPFNLDVHSEICKDKMHCYTLLKDIVRMPKTIQFLDYNTQEKYKQYIEFPSLTAIAKEIENNFKYPVVIKQNKGSLGNNVFLCYDKGDVEKSINAIFDHHSKLYDYVALAQTFVPTQQEFRLMCCYGKPVFAYYRGKSQNFNLKYWDAGELATLVDDEDTLEELYAFVKPLFTTFDIPWVGFDIIRGKDRKLYLIELNATPKFDHILENKQEALIIEMYKKALRNFAKKNQLNI